MIWPELLDRFMSRCCSLWLQMIYAIVCSKAISAMDMFAPLPLDTLYHEHLHLLSLVYQVSGTHHVFLVMPSSEALILVPRQAHQR